MAKEDNGNTNEKNEEAKANGEAKTNEVQEEIKTRSAEKSEKAGVAASDINQNLKNIKLEDLNDEDDNDSLQRDLLENSNEIEEQITHLIATGHMFKAHVLAKKAFRFPLIVFP